MATQTLPTAETAHDAFPINGTDYVEFYAGNAKQASHFYRGAFPASSLSATEDRRRASAIGRATSCSRARFAWC